ncbi:MAG TPA: TonB family protein [bacterium]|nr:TonB family protein [bacterium]
MTIWIHEAAGGWAEYFGWAVIQNSIFLGIVILLLKILRDAPAGIRYGIGLAGLVKLIIPPFLAAPFLKPAPRLLSSLSLIGVQPVTFVPENAPPPPPPQPSLSVILFISWTAFLLVFLLWPILASIRMRSRLSNAIPVDPQGAEGIRVLKTDRIQVPMTFGLFRESIYVPAMWDEWSCNTRRMILSHETAHIRRRDGLVRIFQILVQAIYFFHPMVWYISRRMNESREMACDDLCTHNEKTLSVEYSRALVQIAERLVRPTVDCPSASALIRQKNELLNRVQYQMEDTMKTISRKRTASILAGLLVLTVPLSWMRAKPAQEDSPPPPPPPAEQQAEMNPIRVPMSNPISLPMSFPEGGYAAIQKNLVYPEAARKAGIEARVVVRVHYTEKGFKDADIAETSFETGKDYGLHQAALDAVRSVRWGEVKGAEEAGGQVYVPIEFRLSPPPLPPPNPDGE